MIGFKTSHNMLQVGRVGYKIASLLFLKIIGCQLSAIIHTNHTVRIKPSAVEINQKKCKFRLSFQERREQKGLG